MEASNLLGKNILDECAKAYPLLNQQEVMAAVESGITRALREVFFGACVSVFVEGKSLSMVITTSYGREFSLSFKDMKKRVRRRATWYLEKEMMQANSLKEASIIRHRFQGEILYGVIESGGKDAKVWIDLNSKEINESRFASFPLKYQPKHERGKYKKGKEMAFIVARVNLIKHHNGSLATEIVLSRTAVDLPKKLLEQQTPETFTTLRRVPGKYTLLLAHKNPKRLDKKVIKAIKKEIGEVLIFKEADR